MEKRTMGTLMAAMRKARGLTQQQVADRLGVSNKTVSKWECDDGSPDIAMLPAIAEIYGITVDELLRGEVNGEKQILGASAQERTEKQKAYLLNSARMRYRTVSIISVSIGVLSPVAAVVVGYSFYRCFLSLGASVLFMLAALIVQAVGVNKYWFSLRAADIDDLPLQRFYRSLRNGILFTLLPVLLGLMLGIGGTLGCPDGFSYANGVIESPTLYLLWAALCALCFGVLTRLFRAHLQTKERTHLFSKKARRTFVFGLVLLTILSALLPYVIALWTSQNVYTFQSRTQRDAFIQWQEGKDVLLQQNDAQRTAYVLARSFSSLAPDDSLMQTEYVSDNSIDAVDLQTPADPAPVDADVYMPEDLDPPLRDERFLQSDVRVYTFETTDALRDYVQEHLLDSALFGDLPLQEIQTVLRLTDTEVRYRCYEIGYSIASAAIQIAATDALWCFGWLLAALRLRKKERKQ